MQMARLTYNVDRDTGKLELGDKVLSVSLVLANYQFGTYDTNDKAPNEITLIPYGLLEGQWHYIYMGYNRDKQLATYYTFDGKEIKEGKNANLLHKPLGQ